MATTNPFAQAATSKTPAKVEAKVSVSKGKRVSAAQAQKLAAMLKGKGKVAKPAMDAEDKIDGGIDEDKE